MDHFRDYASVLASKATIFPKPACQVGGGKSGVLSRFGQPLQALVDDLPGEREALLIGQFFRRRSPYVFQEVLEAPLTSDELDPA